METILIWIWRIWTYIWRVLVNFIELAVLFIIFSSAETKFETIAFSLLAMIYLTIRSSFAFLGYIKQKEIIGTVEMFNHLRKLLKEEIDSDELDAVKEEKKKWGYQNVKMWINLVFISIFYFIALFNLLRVTVF